MSIDVFEDREILIEDIVVVFLEVGCEYYATFFYEEFSFFSIDELSDIFTSLWCFDKREPDWFWFFVDVGDNLYTLATVELVIEWDDLSVDLGHSELVSET